MKVHKIIDGVKYYNEPGVYIPKPTIVFTYKDNHGQFYPEILKAIINEGAISTICSFEEYFTIFPDQ